tara:strand:+ start:560 stop:772 length:213 start_codon:yes stop_codon:yes gene_type:complete
MKYALIKDTMKVVSIKEVEIDKVNFNVTITSMKDEVYVEQYLDSDETLNRLLSLNDGFNSSTVRNWWETV